MGLEINNSNVFLPSFILSFKVFYNTEYDPTIVVLQFFYYE
jgi:hypothetical protein